MKQTMPMPFLVSNEARKTAATLSDVARYADRVDVAVSFLSSSEPLLAWLTRGLRVRLVVALQAPTNADVLRDLTGVFPALLKAKFYSAGFHSKLLVFYRNDSPFCAQVGSSNLTSGGLYSNLETNVLLREPKQLDELSRHFNRIWDHSADLHPTDLGYYEKHCQRIASEVAKIRKKQQEFEGRFVRPPISPTTRSPIVKEARDYLQFWRAVDEVVGAVRPVSERQFPGVRPYLAVDHFWHWLVKVWDQSGVKQLRNDSNKRKERLPELFAEYAEWHKSERGYSRFASTRRADDLRRILSEGRLATLTKRQAESVYRQLHAGHLRVKRFGADKKFSRNSLPKIRRAFDHLLWSDSDVQERISSLLRGGRFRLNEFGPSCVQELIGFVHSKKMPIRNDKADDALELLGFRFR